MTIRKRKKQQAAQSAPAERRVEVVRSFTRKVNLDRFSTAKTYESVDFFASAKSECAWDDRQEVAAELYQFCRGDVMSNIREFAAEIRTHQAAVQKRELPSIEAQDATRMTGNPTPIHPTAARNFEAWKEKEGLA